MVVESASAHWKPGSFRKTGKRLHRGLFDVHEGELKNKNLYRRSSFYVARIDATKIIELLSKLTRGSGHFVISDMGSALCVSQKFYLYEESVLLMV